MQQRPDNRLVSSFIWIVSLNSVVFIVVMNLFYCLQPAPQLEGSWYLEEIHAGWVPVVLFFFMVVSKETL